MARTYTLFLLACLVGLAAIMATASATTTTTKHFCYSTPSLLGGDLTSCRTPTDTTVCTGGYASSEAWVRYFRSKGEPTVHLMPLDFLSSFSQMHSLKWDVNALFYQHYNANAWVSPPDIIGGNNQQLQLMRQRNFPWVLTNIDIKPDSQFVQYREIAWVDAETQIGFMVMATSSAADYNYDFVSSGMRALEELSRLTPTVKHVVVLDVNTASGASNFSSNLAALQQNTLFKIDAYYVIDASATPSTRVVNGTFVAIVYGEGYSRSGQPADNVMCLDFQVDGSSKVFNISIGAYSTKPLPSNLRDSNYYADVAFSQSLAEEAIVDDPVIGYTTALPLVSDLGAGINNCLAGDCGIGNLFTDAFRWQMGTDVAMFNSNGVIGSGWTAGARHYSDTFAADPWPDTMNVATLTGLSLWEALNASLSSPMTNANPAGFSSNTLQMSGIRLSYGFNLRPVKLLSVDILNRATGVYEPLNRLKLYSVMMSVYEVCCMEPYATIMTKARYRGETAAVDHPDLPLQRVLASFLTATTTASNPYVVTQYVRMKRVDTGVTEADAMNWHQVQGDCPVNTFWDAGIATCMPCPVGLVQPSTGQTTCQPPASTVNVTAIVVPIVVVFVVVIAIVSAALVRSSASKRSTANAPTSGRITIMFTDIQDSTRLWGALPTSMAVALGQHHELIRAAIAKHKGYEVKTIGDSFMIAVSSEDAGVQIAVEIQRSLQAASWPPCLARAYACKSDEELEAIDDDPSATPVVDATFNGLRVRIGIHSGEPKAELDPVTKGYDYYGPMVNVASRVENAARGGQICVTSDVLSRLSSTAGLSIRALGKYDLKGVVEGAEVHELIPDDLTSREDTFGIRFTAEAGGEVPGSGSEGHSEASSVDWNTFVVEVNPALLTLHFTAGLLRPLASNDANKVRAALLTAWRVTDDSDDLALQTLCRRVLPFALRQITKLRSVDDEAGGLARPSGWAPSFRRVLGFPRTESDATGASWARPRGDSIKPPGQDPDLHRHATPLAKPAGGTSVEDVTTCEEGMPPHRIPPSVAFTDDTQAPP